MDTLVDAVKDNANIALHQVGMETTVRKSATINVPKHHVTSLRGLVATGAFQDGMATPAIMSAQIPVITGHAINFPVIVVMVVCMAVLNSGIDPVVYAVGGCLFGVIVSLSCAVIIVYIRKAIIKRRWYNFDTSARESSTQIYDEIVLSSGSTLGSISNTYTDIRSELTVENIEESSSRFSRYYELQDIGTSKSVPRHHLEIDDKAAIIHSDKHVVGTSSRVNTDSLDGRGVALSWPTTLTKQQETKHLSYKCDVSASSVNRSRSITHLDNGARDSCINYRDMKCNSFEQVQLHMGRNEGEDSGSVYYLHPIS
ncbi:uncharacterized protein LOC128555881 [Mercenaria mercenaria]|uniref:uncharacterized protein LOC128555881 n=1 Tax=Mercenaria mercenaria TaxID=6596 RepID=UPI00234F1512|nr:uncharacterized protein LOC128555881 [Mercenaria mercenaria]